MDIPLWFWVATAVTAVVLAAWAFVSLRAREEAQWQKFRPVTDAAHATRSHVIKRNATQPRRNS